MRKLILLITFSFLSGYFIADLQGNKSVMQSANAMVAGLDSYDLKTDYDFKKAVKSIVEDSCEIINYNGHLELDCR